MGEQEVQIVVVDPLNDEEVFDVTGLNAQKEEHTVVDPLDRTVTLEVDMASQREVRFNLVKGTWKLVVFQLEDEEDVSAARNAKLTIKRSFAEDDADIMLQKDHDPTESNLSIGKIAFKFLPTDTRSLDPATYWYDVQLELTKEEEIFQVAIGNLIIERTIWRRV